MFQASSVIGCDLPPHLTLGFETVRSLNRAGRGSHSSGKRFSRQNRNSTMLILWVLVARLSVGASGQARRLPEQRTDGYSSLARIQQTSV